MTPTATGAPRWIGLAQSAGLTWAMRSLPRWRSDRPGWPPDVVPAVLIVAFLLFVAGGALVRWLQERDSTRRPWCGRMSAWASTSPATPPPTRSWF